MITANKQVFIIGTGRSGSKLMAELLSKGSNISKFGEVENGPIPHFYKDVYEGNTTIVDNENVWMDTRLMRMSKSQDVYLEKNHLIAPMLKSVYRLFPHAKFIYLKRSFNKIHSSFVARGTYGPKDIGAYAKGRLEPRATSSMKYIWHELDQEEKIAWMLNEYIRLCLTFKRYLQSVRPVVWPWWEVSYEELINKETQMSLLHDLYQWIGIDGFHIKTLENTFQKQIGTKTKR